MVAKSPKSAAGKSADQIFSKLMQRARVQFKKSPFEYTMMPFWHWNDDIRADEIKRQLDQMRAQHVYDTMISTGVGLIQPYLSEAYFELYKFTLREARKRGMRVWVYDEYCWPSGTAAGKIPELYPEYRMVAGRFYAYPLSVAAPRRLSLRLPPGRVIRAWAERAGASGTFDIMDAVGDTMLDWRAPRGEWTATLCVITPVQTKPESCTGSRWTSDTQGYTDVMNREAVAKYIELVYEAHYRAAPEFFGNTMPGFFTDEAGFLYDIVVDGGRDVALGQFDSKLNPLDVTRYGDNPVFRGLKRSVPWTNNLLGIFKERYGYDLGMHLPELVRGTMADKGVCYDYFRLLSDLFAENYCAQIGEWCAKHNVVFTGHWSEGINRGDLQRQIAAQQMPGIDVLGGETPFQKSIMLPRQAASIARAYDRQRVVAETYGVTKWDFELADKIKGADMLTVLGVNTHSSIDYAYSFRSFRKHSCNPPGFFQAPSWKYQRYFSEHLARLCLATSLGRAAVETAIFFPSEAALSNTIPDPAANGMLEHNIRSVFTSLMEQQIEADFVFESALGQARFQNGRITYPGAAYRTLILPAVDVLARKTIEDLTRFVKSGGQLIVFWRMPTQDPHGKKLGPNTRALFGAAQMPANGLVIRRRCGRGEVIMRPDPMGMVTTSAEITGGKKENFFDGTNSLICTAKHYPQWIAIDLGQPLDLRSFTLALEEGKKNIRYKYIWQVSSDARQWRDLARVAQAGCLQTTRLSGKCIARHVRLFVEEGGGRIFGLHNLAIEYRAEKGVSHVWQPPVVAQMSWRQLLGQTSAPLEFYDQSGKLGATLVFNTRIIGKERLMAVMNRSAEELSLTARLPENAAQSELELWDQDSGTIKALGRPDSDFPVTFAPYECRVFVATPRKAMGVRTPLAQLNCAGRPILETRGPWPFSPMRPNAYPLMAGNLQMADPSRPKDWLTVKDGRIPKPLRRTQYVLFDCRIVMKKTPLGTEELLFDEGLLAELRINGKPLPCVPQRNRYLDTFGLSALVGKLLRRGENRITGWFMPEFYERTMRGIYYNENVLQPTFDVYLLGDFAVIGNNIVDAPKTLDQRPWQEQGYPFYSGTGIYTVKLDLANVPPGIFRLEVGSRKGVAEARIAKSGLALGVRTHWPWAFDLPAKAGQEKSIELEIRVTNTIGSAFAAQQIGTLVGAIAKYESGLQFARIIASGPRV